MRLSIATKIFIAFSSIIVIFMSVMITGLLHTQQLHEQMHTLNRDIVPLSLLLSDAQNDLRSFDAALSAQDPDELRRTLRVAQMMSVAPERFARKIYRATALSAPARFEQLDARTSARMISIHQRLDAIGDQAHALNASTKALALALQNQRELQDEATTGSIITVQRTTQSRTRRLDKQLSHIQNDMRVLTDLSLVLTTDQQRTNSYVLGVMISVALLVSLGVMIVVVWTLKPLGVLTHAAKRVAQGDYSPIPQPNRAWLGEDEIRALTHEFNSMAGALSARDQTLKGQHQALLRAERLATIGRMTSVVTHELRNPLSSIGLNAEMLLETIRETQLDEHAQQDMIDHLELITMEVDRLSDITEEYLVYARLPTPRPAPHDVTEIVEQLIDFHQMEWFKHSIDLSSPDHPLIAHVDPNQLRQAMLNLIKNGVEAQPESDACQIDIQIFEQDTHIHMTVRDYGTGIDPQNRARLFEPFFTSKSQGTGLGLAMTMQIVEGHQGQILVDAPTHGPGTVFTILLPAPSKEVPS